MALSEIISAAALQARLGHKSSCYWWNADIVKLRRRCNHLRKRAFRAKNKISLDAQRMLKNEVRRIRGILRVAIIKAKASAWDQLLTTFDADSWGRPYRVAIKKLKKSSPLGCEKLPNN